MRYALKFAYDGPRFEGYARQPGKVTVEGEIVKAMAELGMIADAKTGNFRSASRTDRGVSAAGNVLAFDTDFPHGRIIQALNSNLDGIVFHGIARVPDDFNPRHARQRWYRYFLTADGAPSKEKLGKAAKLFLGEHDFRLFCKKDTGRENTILTIVSIEIQETDGIIIIDIRARRFLWELVRRMLAAMVDVAAGRMTRKAVKGMLKGEKIPGGIKPLPPEYLVLMDVEYDFDFENASGGDYFRELATELRLRAQVAGEISKIF